LEKTQQKKLTSATAIVMSSIIVSRLTGFVREMLVPNVFDKAVSDAYYTAFKVTQLMYDMLVGGAIAAALIPILSGYIAKGKEKDGWKAAGTFINLVFMSMILVCTLGMIFTRPLVKVIAIGFKGESTELTVTLTRILFPSVAFLMLAGLANGVLNSYNRFAAAAYGPSIYNIGSAVSILLFSKYGPEAVAFGVMCSSIIYFLFQLSFAIKNMKYYRFRLYIRHPGFLKLFRLAIPSLLSSSIVQVNVIISLMFTSLFDQGSVTAFNMADRTWQMPYGIFAQGIGIAMLPTLSATLVTGDVSSYKSILLKSLKTVLFFTVPSAVGIVVLNRPIIKTIFEFSDVFTEDLIPIGGQILMYFSIALMTQSIVTVMNRAFYANNDTKTPLYIGSSTILMNIVLSFILYRFTNLNTAGMALSYSLTSATNAILLLVILNKKMNGIYLGRLVKFASKVMVASVVMGIGIYFLNKVPFNLDSKMMQILHLLLMVGVGAVLYFGCIIVLGIKNVSYFFDNIFEKLKLSK